MSKMTINVSESAVANPFLSPDGLLNYVKVAALQEKVAAALKAADKAGEPIKPSAVYVKRARAKVAAYKASLDSKGTDLKYRAARATKIAMRKRLAPEALARVAIILQVIDAPKLNAQIKQAVSALTQHMKRCEKHLDKLTTEKAKIRDKANAEFDKAVGTMRAVLIDGGLKETDVVEAQGMMGKTVLVRLSPTQYVSVVKADKARFLAAVKASKTAKA